MSAMLVGLTLLAVIFASDLPGWFDPYLLLLAFVALRIEWRVAFVHALFVSLVRGSASLDPSWWHVAAGLGGTAMILVMRRWFFASRWFNQIGLTAVLGVAVETAVVMPLRVAYPQLSFLSALEPGVERALWTALVSPLFFGLADRVLFRPRFLQRGLLPATGA